MRSLVLNKQIGKQCSYFVIGEIDNLAIFQQLYAAEKGDFKRGHRELYRALDSLLIAVCYHPGVKVSSTQWPHKGAASDKKGKTTVGGMEATCMNVDEILTVDELLAQIDAATAAARATIEKCTAAQWTTQIEEEGRTVGVVLHHIAYAMPFVVEWALGVARGKGVPAVTYDDVHALNHQHAEAQANVDPATTLALLASNAAAAREALGQLTDADLQTSTPFALIGGNPVTTQQMVQWFLVNHAHNHLGSIDEILKRTKEAPVTTIERSVFINAPPEAVTAVSEDVVRAPEWFTGAKSAAAEDSWPAIGSTARFDMLAPGLAYELTVTVVERVAGEILILDTVGPTTGTTTWRYTAENGGTHVTYTLAYTLSDDAAGQAMGKLIAAGANDVSIGQSLANLKTLVESM